MSRQLKLQKMFVFMLLCVILIWSPKIASGFNFGFGFERVLRPKSRLENQLPAIKTPKKPIITVVDPESQTKISLVGVSHGSEPSATLVAETIQDIKPAAIVLELCEDRFITISLDSQIKPRNNRTLTLEYEKKRQLLIEKNILSPDPPSSVGASSISYWKRTIATLKFAAKQDPIGSVFVCIGLLVSTLQRFSRTATEGDEFVTAMRYAEKYDIPIILGDANQNDTVKSIENVVSSDTINPKSFLTALNSFIFTAFGIDVPYGRPTTGSQAQLRSDILRDSQWISIPGTYAESTSMLKSLFPILLISLIPALADAAGGGTQLVDAIYGISGQEGAGGIELSPNHIVNYGFGELNVPDTLFAQLSSIVDTLSFFILIRMAKIIGADRDIIIAQKVQEAARRYKGKELVVVIGMLHCNGVAKHLISGVRPEAPQTRSMKMNSKRK